MSGDERPLLGDGVRLEGVVGQIRGVIGVDGVRYIRGVASGMERLRCGGTFNFWDWASCARGDDGVLGLESTAYNVEESMILLLWISLFGFDDFVE